MTKRRTRLLIAGAVTAAAAAAVPAVMAAADTREAEPEAACEIAVLDERPGAVQHVSDSGEYLAGFYRSDAGPLPVVWHDGEPTELTQDFHISDINSSGVAVGHRYNAETEQLEAVRWQDGEFTELAAPNPKGGVQAVAINDDGVIAGNTGLTHLDDEVYADIPLRWQAGETESKELEVGAGLLGTAVDIAADGTVAGTQTADHQTGPSSVWAWNPDGDSTELTAPGEPVGPVEAVRGDWVLTREYRWNLSEPETPTANAMYGPADVDDQGRGYGAEWDDSDTSHPAMESEGTITLLPELDDEHSEDTSDYATGVNADGSLVAGSSAKGERQLPVVWRCA